MRRQPHSPVAALFGLLALWIGIELVYSSHWLNSTDNHRPRPKNSRPSNTLRQLLSRPPGQPVARVWFAPYTTFPESVYVESAFRTGVYDTFRAFPANGLKANYGAFKLSLADTLFAQASSQGLRQEANLAQQLGYRLIAIDLGAIAAPRPLQALCKNSSGCRLSSDGYALFPLNATSPGWIAGLTGSRRRLPELLQTNASPRWGSLVFQPNQWWNPDPQQLGQAGSSVVIWAKPLQSVGLYRHDLTPLPPQVAQMLRDVEQRIELRLSPGLDAADLCMESTPVARASSPATCRPIRLDRKMPVVEITRWIPPGRVSRIVLKQAYVEMGLPISRRYLPVLPGQDEGTRRSAFALVLKPRSGLGRG